MDKSGAVSGEKPKYFYKTISNKTHLAYAMIINGEHIILARFRSTPPTELLCIIMVGDYSMGKIPDSIFPGWESGVIQNSMNALNFQ